MAVVISSWKCSVKQHNDLLPWHPLPYRYVNIVTCLYRTCHFLTIVFNCFSYCTPQNHGNILYQTSQCVSVALSLPCTPPLPTSPSLFSLSTTPLPLKYLITCNGNIPLITPCKLASLLSTIKMKIPIT